MVRLESELQKAEQQIKDQTAMVKKACKMLSGEVQTDEFKFEHILDKCEIAVETLELKEELIAALSDEEKENTAEMTEKHEKDIKDNYVRKSLHAELQK